jgi:hypothetical protein
MYKPSIFVVVTYFSTNIWENPNPYIWDLLPTELVTKVKPKIDSVEVHPQLSNKGHPVDGALVDAGSLWPNGFLTQQFCWEWWMAQQRRRVFREKCNEYDLTASPCFWLVNHNDWSWWFSVSSLSPICSLAVPDSVLWVGLETN